MRTKWLVAILAAGTLALAACGSGGDDDESDRDGATATPSNERTASSDRPPQPTAAASPKPQVALPSRPCELLSKSERDRFSDRLGEPREARGDPEVAVGCSWQFNATDDFATLTVEARKFFSGESAETVRARLEQELSFGADVIPGVGQYATYLAPRGQNTIEAKALIEGRLVTVSWTNEKAAAQKKDLLIETLKTVLGRVE